MPQAAAAPARLPHRKLGLLDVSAIGPGCPVVVRVYGPAAVTFTPDEVTEFSAAAMRIEGA